MASSPPYHLRISFVSSCSEPSNTASSVGRNLHPHPSSPEEDLNMENVYYSEMKDAGFFDPDWE
ncbi:hypothetical protein IGI04_001867 [Brassica rapa subsp. trilocularis]|uniref:Uncharacterized protein n=1 Tax=Brassica rapa subsp. trilocularis TaxID=1813537 RepID=A0ABQ7NTU1_BRACM|nr:hypothetical protein IGI04_005399 [Brassica rapa subsp. trilocularis]KAG5414300.1 hypothetical protein IGI04_001867 [Brassica rapa subsp. trilocularis]